MQRLLLTTTVMLASAAGTAHAATAPLQVSKPGGSTRASPDLATSYTLGSGFTRARAASGAPTSDSYLGAFPLADGTRCAVTAKAVGLAQSAEPQTGPKVYMPQGEFRVAERGRSGALRWALGENAKGRIAYAWRPAPSSVATPKRRYVTFVITISKHAAGACASGAPSTLPVLRNAIRTMHVVKR